MIWVGRNKSLVILFTILISGAGYFLWQHTHRKSENSQKEQPNQQLRKWRTQEEIKSSYTYQTLYAQLNSQGVSLSPLAKEEILSQIFPKSKFWLFTNRNGETLYLADGDDKTARSVISDEVLTDKIVAVTTTKADFNRDGREEFIAFTIIKFQDVALCCDQKRFLSIFQKTQEGKWKLTTEVNLEVFYGGEHRGKIKIVMMDNLPIIQLEIEGDYHNGLKSSTVEWYISEGEQIRRIWHEGLSYNTDNVGTYPKESMDNYEGSFEVERGKGLGFHKIRFIKTYTKRAGENLKNAQREEMYYLWDKERKLFQLAIAPQKPGKQE